MATSLHSVLSNPAADLYQRLLKTGGLTLDQLVGDERAAADELISRGFARHRHVGAPRLVPVDPVRAVDNAILVSQQQVLDQYQKLVLLREEVPDLRRLFLTCQEVEPAGLVEVLTDREAIGATSVELVLSARRDVMSLETASFSAPPDPRSARTVPDEVVARGVTLRNIYERACLEVPGAPEMMRLSTAAGWQSRVVARLPMKMVLIDDHAALVPLSPTGVDGAMLVTAPVVVAALRMYFELLWAQATELDGQPHDVLSPTQTTVLTLLTAGLTDTAIGHHLGVGERTVRRHVATLLELAEVDNRVALAAVAVRRRWIS